MGWLFRNRATGRITIVQVPNVWLTLFLACRLGEAVFSSTVLHWGGTVALAFWAMGELISGVNPFRRLLGVSVLLFIAL